MRAANDICMKIAKAKVLCMAAPVLMAFCAISLSAQTLAASGAGNAGDIAVPYLPIPGFDVTSIDPSADPCSDFYKFACGKFAANHPIPADQAGVDQFYALYNVNTQALDGILTKAAAGGSDRSPDVQKIGDYYAACMNTSLIDQKAWRPFSLCSMRSIAWATAFAAKWRCPR